ncbi:hypothetical protein QJS04_geneDACA003806 [Acorus gramineus]|uniref:GH18 domain-containing protein n=1 Tax=Acorus gramineus TaxID=55184 RepID=A0AAV9BKV5_ACOGR|nr:hypothetical protein QJS04_geneDACA003806 [Acorus gramineus]
MSASHPPSVVRGAYYPSWSYESVNPSKIDFSESHFTHLFYAFVNPDPTTFDLVITSDDKPILSDLVSAAHNRSPPVMVLLSIGGGGVAAVFSNMSGAEDTRSRFIRSTIEVARENDVDGFDLDWESPKDAAEMVNLGLLFEEWRAAIDSESATSGQRPLLLTAAVYFSNRFFLPGDVPRYRFLFVSIAKNLDWINAMCYDYHGSWDTSATGEHAALYDATSNVSTSYGLTSWTSSGVPRQKVVMGLPAYGRSWKLKDAAEHGIGAPAVGVGPGVYDSGTGSAYAYKGTEWVGYDDSRSVTQKVRYAEAKGLGGYFFWALGQDLNWILSRQGMASRVFNS